MLQSFLGMGRIEERLVVGVRVTQCGSSWQDCSDLQVGPDL